MLIAHAAQNDHQKSLALPNAGAHPHAAAAGHENSSLTIGQHGALSAYLEDLGDGRGFSQALEHVGGSIDGSEDAGHAEELNGDLGETGYLGWIEV